MMGIDAVQLLNHVIRPTLQGLGLGGPAAERLVLATAAHESHCGTFLRQIRNGPALGIYQMEPATHNDIAVRWPPRHEDVYQRMLRLCGPSFDSARLVYDLRYATAMCRLRYYMAPQALPEADDWEGLARMWKDVYNTRLGKGTVPQFLADCRDFGVMGVA